MKTYIALNAEVTGVSHTWFPADDICHAFGTLNFGGAKLHLYAPAEIDAVIAELVALKQEMDPPARIGIPERMPVPQSHYCDSGNCKICGDGTGDDPEPVITDSERTCDQANPLSGDWCHKGGDHDVHRDTDGQTWTAVRRTEVAASR